MLTFKFIQQVSVCTTCCNFKICSFFQHSVICFSLDSHKAIISLHDINLFFVRVRDSVLCEVELSFYVRYNLD